MLELAAAAPLVAHELVDHSSGNAGVFQPGREGMAQVVGPVGIDRDKVMAGASDRALVDAAEVVPGQHGPRARRDAVAASRAGEDGEVGVAVRWELPADGLDHQSSERQLPDAGVALGAGFEAAAELATDLVAHVDDLEGGHGPIEMDPAAAQAGQLTEPQSCSEKGEDVIPPEQWNAGEQSASFLGCEGAAPPLG
jgi:hypothetical protein